MIEIFKKPCKLLLSLFLSLSFVFLSVSADDSSEYPVLYSVGNVGESFSYISMVKTENDVWDRFIDDVSGFIGDSNSYLIGFNTDTIVVGWGNIYWSPSNVNLIICENYRYTYITDDQWYAGSGNNPFLITNVLPIAMQGVPVSAPGSVSANFQNYNSVTWDMAVSLYENSDSSNVSNRDILDAIIDGTDDSGESADSAEDSNNDLESVLEQYENIESVYIDDFQENLSNIDVGGFEWGADFLISAAWVTDQFNLLVMETPFELLITYSLIIGIGLFLIGRYKGL